MVCSSCTSTMMRLCQNVISNSTSVAKTPNNSAGVIFFILSLLLLPIMHHDCLVSAFFVAGPHITSTRLRSSSTSRNAVDNHTEVLAAAKTNCFRMRTAKYQDVDKISAMLASASIQTDDLTNANTLWWNLNINSLKAKSSYHKQVSQRFRAIEEAKKQLVSFQSLSITNNNDNFSIKQRFLWESDSFRDQLKQAINSYCECCENKDKECYWSNHNYIILHPEEEPLLQHAMIVVEQVNDDNRNEVVGFVEIAMFVPKPSIKDQREQEHYQPTIMNLVVSPLHRRQGIANRLISLAIRYVRKNWMPIISSPQLPQSDASLVEAALIGLYVLESNVAALSLYNQLGFVRLQCNDDNDTRCYLERPISLVSTSIQRLTN